jgi:hypothetical protein
MPEADGDGGLFKADTSLFESGYFADATIVCGDRTWKVHKLILGSRCKWFKAAFFGNMAVSAAFGHLCFDAYSSTFWSFEELTWSRSFSLRRLRLERSSYMTRTLILSKFYFDSSMTEVRWKKPILHKSTASKILTAQTGTSSLSDQLSDSQDSPALCVRLFRLADFFLLEELSKIARDVLSRYLTEKTNEADDSAAGLSPKLAAVFEAVREVYKDESAKSLREVLLIFIWRRKDQYFKIPECMDLLNEISELGKDLVKVCLAIDPTTDQPSEQGFHQPLTILEAVFPDRSRSYMAGGPVIPSRGVYFHINSPCQLRQERSQSNPFKSVDLATNSNSRHLTWITPWAPTVVKMLNNGKSSVVSVFWHICSPGIHIRFLSPEDASYYVRTYRKANPRIKVVKQSATKLESELRKCYDEVTGVVKDEYA